MIFSIGAGQLDLVSHSLIGLSLIFCLLFYSEFPQNTPIIPKDCPIILRKLSGDSGGSTITLQHN